MTHRVVFLDQILKVHTGLVRRETLKERLPGLPSGAGFQFTAPDWICFTNQWIPGGFGLTSRL
jgi:hypothetical protein